MSRILFYPALWAGKFFLWWYRRRGRNRNDKPGMASMRLCSRFLEYVAKPPLTICVSGTNGKTTVTSLIASVLKREGKSVAYNDWGANHHAGQARCLLDAVTIFNRPTKDVAVIEMDELVSPLNVPRIAPQYFVINNLGRDSMMRNANPEFIRSRVAAAADATPKATVIVNADDPLCCFLGEKNRRLYFGADDLKLAPRQNLVSEFTACPRCGALPVYDYRQYRQIGRFHCPNCGLKTPEHDFFAKDVNFETMELPLREPDGVHTYPIVSDSVFNIYNELAAIAVLRDLGIPAERLAEHLRNVQVPASRQTDEVVEGVLLRTQMAKGQNPAAASTVFESVGRDMHTKELVVLLDEVFDDPRKSETIAWIFDTDYEFLNSDRVRRIIVGGERYLDHRVRFLMAGVPEEKLVCVRDPFAVPQFVDTKNVEEICILHDVVFVSGAHRIRDAIAERIRAERTGEGEK